MPATACSPAPAPTRPLSSECTTVISESHTERQTSLLVRVNGHVYDSCWEQHEVDLEEIVLAYLGYGSAAAHRSARAREAAIT